ncbi:MAG TPA: CcmD family protein [Chitinophagaceae bacterium]
MKQKLTILICTLFLHLMATAQEKVEMADTMRSNGKIYVVVAIILTIFAGLAFYLVRLDRKITKLEKNNN